MSQQQIYINLPIKDMERSKRFFGALGFDFDPRFTNEQGACLVIADGIYGMLLVEPFFQTFTKKPVADATQSTEVLHSLSRESREAVDQLVAKALAAGGRARRAARPRIHVRPRLRGPGRPPVGAGLHERAGGAVNGG